MNIFEYLNDSTPAFLVGQFTEESYKKEIKKRKEKLACQIMDCLQEKADDEIKRQLAFQLEMIKNHRHESWDYPIFCFNLAKKSYQFPHFHITKGYNKLLANWLARRSYRNIPIAVINYGERCEKIKIEKQVSTYEEFVDWLGKEIDLDFTFIRWENQLYPVIEQLSENIIKIRDFSIVNKWISILKSCMDDGKISIIISDQHSSQISDSSGFFQIHEESPGLYPTGIERTTHIREYKNLLKNDDKIIDKFILVTNRKIRLDLFDIIWFLQDHASDYVSEDRSYSILGPGAFRADSVLPGSEL